MFTAIAKDLGVIGYQAAWAMQEELCHQVLQRRLNPNESSHAGYVLTCQHPHVYTLGRSGNPNNLRIGPDRLQAIGATFCHTNRGGDITYHGPGQIVVYPILDLDKLGIGVRDYVMLLEEGVIRTLMGFGIEGKRIPGASGVWLGGVGKEQHAKICAIGVRVSRSITMHGLALNVSTDLQYFLHINPCGLAEAGVTSMALALGSSPALAQVRAALLKELYEGFRIGRVFEREG